MKKIYLLAVTGLLCASSALAQSAYKRCETAEHLQDQLAQDQGMQARMNAIESFTEKYLKNSANKRTSAVVTIPVVVHVVYKTAAQNVSDKMIQDQIAVLNKDFAKMNSDASKTPSAFTAAATNVQFKLATVTPSGAPTNGIVRTSTKKVSFSSNDGVKKSSTGGSNAWDASKYLNIWVCNLGNGLLGYAQFPGGPAATDGVVILYSSLPGGSAAPYNLGRTATHEVGHWLNLRHIWGDATCGNDLVSDTPTHNTANYGCPASNHRSTCSGTPLEMTMNYMDYTDDACMYMFTAGQAARMDALLAPGGARASLVSSNGASLVSNNGNAAPQSSSDYRNLNIAPATVFPNPVTEQMNISYSVAFDKDNVQVEIFNMLGAKVASYSEGSKTAGTYVFSVDNSDKTFGNLQNGMYICRVKGANEGKAVRFILER